MKKSELIQAIMQKTKKDRFDTEEFLNTTFSIISDRISNGEKVYLSGFGTFEVRDRVGHRAKNPRTGEDIMIDGYKSPVFKASNSLKERVNKK